MHNINNMLWNVLLLLAVFTKVYTNERPIIGIVTQETTHFPGFDTMLVASYVKFVEGSGARVVPVWIGREDSYYKEVIDSTNGILFPGGGADFFSRKLGYGEASRKLYDYAMEVNNKGIYYPILGICLGMEVMIFAELKGKNVLCKCNSDNVSLPLEFEPGYRKSKLFSAAPEDVISILKTENVAYNAHMFCYKNETFVQYNLLKDWRIMSTNEDINGLRFISSIEHKKYPFYSVIYHPEKNIYEFNKNYSIPHSLNAIKASRFISTFFIEESRKNNNKYASKKKELEAMIDNFCPIFTAKKNNYFDSIYLFNLSVPVNE